MTLSEVELAGSAVDESQSTEPRLCGAFFVSCSMENEPKFRAATDELALLEFDIDALQSRHVLPMDEVDLPATQQRALQW